MKSTVEVPEGVVPEIRAEDLEFLHEVDAALPQEGVVGAELAAVDRYLELIREERARVARVQAAAELRMQPIREWVEREQEKAQRKVEFLEARIRFLLPHDADSFKREYGTKSLALTHGARVGYEKGRDRVEIMDEAKAVTFARQHGIPVAEKVSTTVPKTALKDYVTTAGVEPDPDTDGFLFVPGAERFYVKPGDDT